MPRKFYKWLLNISSIVLLLLFVTFPFIQNETFHKLLFNSIFILLGVYLGINIFAVITILINSKTKSISFFPTISKYFLNNQMYPIVHKLYKSSSPFYEKYTDVLLNINNKIAKKQLIKFKPQDILILLPHCLQNADCRHKITYDINNCVECNKCVIADFKRLKKKYNISIRVATGGTLARKIVKDERPKVIFAVACYRDLIEGVRDITVIPTIGILNERPNGPCYNTTCDVDKLESIILQYL